MKQFMILRFTSPRLLPIRKDTVFYSALGVALLFPLLLNRYPIVFSDTGTYIRAFRGVYSYFNPVDRPIFYSIFVYYAGIFGKTLIFVVIAQISAFIYVLYRVENIIFGQIRRTFGYGFLISCLPISYTAVLCCAIMPDIWGEIGFISLVVFLSDRGRIVEALFLLLSILFAPANGVVYFISTCFYMSFVFMTKNKNFNLWRFVVVVSMIVFGILINSFVNDYTYNRFSPIAASASFTFAALNRDGLLDNAVHRYCATQADDSICIQYPNYRQVGSNKLLWSDLGNKIGLWDIRRQSDFAIINKDAILEHKKAYALNVIHRIEMTIPMVPTNLNQLYGTAYPQSSSVYGSITRYYDLAAFERSAQQTRPHAFWYLSFFKRISLYLLVAAIATMLVIFKRITKQKWFIIFAAFSYMFFNAAVLGGLSEPAARYNVRGYDICLIFLVSVALSLLPQSFFTASDSRAKQAVE